MIFIIGGRSQGKTDYVLKNYPSAEICDGADMSTAELENIACIDNFHLLIKRIMAEGGSEAALAVSKKIYEQNPDIIIISTYLPDKAKPANQPAAVLSVFRHSIPITTQLLSIRQRSSSRHPK